MLTGLAVIIFFVLSELFALSGGFWFWLLVLLVFSYWILRRENHEHFQDVSLVGASLIILFLNFHFQNVFDLSWIFKQIHCLILTGLFFGLLRFYHQPYSGWRKNVFAIILVLAATFLGSWFFHAGILEGLFFKEIVLFVGSLIIFRAGQRMVFKSSQSELGEESQFLFPWVGNILAILVLVELAWFLGFLPINFLSLAGIWLLFFYLVWELFNWIWKRNFSFSHFLAQALLIAVLVVIILASANWKII